MIKSTNWYVRFTACLLWKFHFGSIVFYLEAVQLWWKMSSQWALFCFNFFLQEFNQRFLGWMYHKSRTTKQIKSILIRNRIVTFNLRLCNTHALIHSNCVSIEIQKNSNTKKNALPLVDEKRLPHVEHPKPEHLWPLIVADDGFDMCHKDRDPTARIPTDCWADPTNDFKAFERTIFRNMMLIIV